MYLDKRFYQCQPDTGTGMMPVDLIETVEDAADMFCRNQTSGIGDRKTEERSALFLQSRKPDMEAVERRLRNMPENPRPKKAAAPQRRQNSAAQYFDEW